MIIGTRKDEASSSSEKEDMKDALEAHAEAVSNFIPNLVEKLR